MRVRLPLLQVSRTADDEQAGVAARRPPYIRALLGPEIRASVVAAFRARVPARILAAVTVAPTLLAIAWLAPGTGMLLAGRLLAVPMVIIFVPLAVALCYFTVRVLPSSWPEGSPLEPARPRAGVPAPALLAMVVIAAGFGLWQAVFRSEQVFVTSDPGVYLQYGSWIAGHGSARIPVSAAAFGGGQGLAFATPGFTLSGSSLTPAFMPGLPLVLAGGAWLGGLGGALLMPAVIGGCAVLTFGGLVGRLCGPWWPVTGELVLAVGLPEVYTSRTPFSEPLVQVLLFGGLCLFTDSLVVRRRVLAALGGLALGLTVLASIASLDVLLPAFPVLAALLVARRPQGAPFGAGLILGLGTALAAGLVLARAYLSALSAPLHIIELCALGWCVVTALTLALAIPDGPARVRRAFAYRVEVTGFNGDMARLPSLGALALWLARVLPVVVLAALALRPYLQAVRGQTDPAMIRAVAALQRLEGLPVDGRRQYYESSLSWVLWYLGAPALLLACAGAAGLGRRSVAAVLVRRPGGSNAGAMSPALGTWLWGLPFVIVAWSVVTVLWDPSVVPWQPMASHRLVPVVLPGLVLFGLWAASWLMSRASALDASRATLAVVGTCCVLALAVPPLVTTLNPGRTSASASVAAGRGQLQLHGVGATATYGGSAAAAAALCAAIGPSASALVTDATAAAVFGPFIRGVCGQPTALLVPRPFGAAAADLAQAVRSVEQAGRRPVLLGLTRASVTLLGAIPQQVVSLPTAGDAESLTAAPTGTWPVTYTVWLAASPGAGGSS